MSSAEFLFLDLLYYMETAKKAFLKSESLDATGRFMMDLRN